MKRLTKIASSSILSMGLLIGTLGTTASAAGEYVPIRELFPDATITYDNATQTAYVQRDNGLSEYWKCDKVENGTCYIWWDE
ncbi:hypothetical protein [Bacillus sp. SM2101]|uniref:hypothetical protein n=1 Tax=Bacillus sp. SM2101 TaxID=2805366 RepID=UPI001BDDEA4D|nr:hypothetical protein [Bacillus sp. SM2101]